MAHLSLAVCALKQAGLHSRPTLPEPAAVGGMLVIKRPLGLRINKFTTVWDHTPVIGQAVSPRVVGHGVPLGGGGHTRSSTHANKEQGREHKQLIHSHC